MTISRILSQSLDILSPDSWLFRVATEGNKPGERNSRFPLYSCATCGHSLPLLDSSPALATLGS